MRFTSDENFRISYPMIWMLLLLLAASALKADDSQGKAGSPSKEAEEQVYDLVDGIKPPRLVHQVNPDYSRVRGVRVKGSVAIAVVVSSEGAAKDPRVVQSLHPDVDRCAVEAIRQWRFAPAQKDGKAVAVRVTIELEFHSM